MLLRVDHEHLQSLLAYLGGKGFPATQVGEDRLDVLFPASPPLFAAAVELDDWLARSDDDVVLRIEG